MLFRSTVGKKCQKGKNGTGRREDDELLVQIFASSASPLQETVSPLSSSEMGKEPPFWQLFSGAYKTLNVTGSSIEWSGVCDGDDFMI